MNLTTRRALDCLEGGRPRPPERAAAAEDGRTPGRIESGKSCRVRTELENFSWRRASARCPTAVFGPKTPPGRAAPRNALKLNADPT